MKTSFCTHTYNLHCIVWLYTQWHITLQYSCIPICIKKRDSSFSHSPLKSLHLHASNARKGIVRKVIQKGNLSCLLLGSSWAVRRMYYVLTLTKYIIRVHGENLFLLFFYRFAIQWMSRNAPCVHMVHFPIVNTQSAYLSRRNTSATQSKLQTHSFFGISKLFSSLSGDSCILKDITTVESI